MTEEDTERWDLTRHLSELGMSREEAEGWVKARQAGQPFKADWSDGIGHQLDKVWKRNVHIGPVHLRRRTLIAILWAYSFATWVYVTVFQMVNPESFNWSFVVWLPWLKMSYLGGAALLSSLVLASIWFAIEKSTKTPASVYK
jgi:hypothetical protein